MRLIDADNLKEAFYNRKRTPDDMKYLRVPAELVYQFIENAPTVKERPQVVIFSENMTAEEKQKLIAEFKAVMDNAKFTIEPERPQGEWKYKIDVFHSGGFDYCSICNFPTPIYLEKPNFCPNCGAYMKGGAE